MALNHHDRTFFLRRGALKAPNSPGRLERAKDSLTSGLKRVAECRDAVSDTTEISLAVLHVRLGSALSRTRSKAGDTTAALSEWFNAALGTVEFGGLLNDWLSKTFASGKASAYDKAMDAVYNATHQWGGNHRIFDGGHSCLGAWEACSQAAQDKGDDFAAQVGGYLGAMWKDLVTPKGLPIATWDPEGFRSAQEMLLAFGLSKDWLSGMVCVNASDLMGATTAVLSLTLGWSRTDIDKFSELAGNFGVSCALGTNPLLAVVALICLGRAYQLAKGRQAKSRIVIGGAKGGIGSAIFLGAMTLLSANVWIGLMAGVVASILARKAFEAGQRQIEAVDWTETCAFILSSLRRAMPAAAPATGAFPPA